MQHYWVSAIIQNESDKKAWCLSLNDSSSSLEEAKISINNLRNNHTVLSAWVDVFDGEEKINTVFHECYVNFVGHVTKPTVDPDKKNYVEKTKSDCLLEAFKKNAIITSDGLGKAEFIYVYGHKAYYEDGACLGTFSEANELLNSQEWTHKYSWYVVRYLTEDEISKIEKMRTSPRVYESAWHEREINKILNNK